MLSLLVESRMTGDARTPSNPVGNVAICSFHVGRQRRSVRLPMEMQAAFPTTRDIHVLYVFMEEIKLLLTRDRNVED